VSAGANTAREASATPEARGVPAPHLVRVQAAEGLKRLVAAWVLALVALYFLDVPIFVDSRVCPLRPVIFLQGAPIVVRGARRHLQ
jgi:hypothetical protein